MYGRALLSALCVILNFLLWLIHEPLMIEANKLVTSHNEFFHPVTADTLHLCNF